MHTMVCHLGILGWQGSINLKKNSPIYCKLDVGQLDTKLETEVNKKAPSYNKANNDERQSFQDTTKDMLNNIDIPACINCQDKHCKMPSHRESIEQFYLRLIVAHQNINYFRHKRQ